MKLTVSVFLILVTLVGCGPSGRVNVGPADTRPVAVPTPPPTN